MKKNAVSRSTTLIFPTILAVSIACTPAPKYRIDKSAAPAPSRSVSRSEQNRVVKPARFSPPVKNYSTSRINSRFGIRTHPVYHTTEFHHGIDIKGKVGEGVYAVDSGSIIFSGNQSGYGKVLIIDHGNRLYSVYAHLSQIFADKGSSVAAGDMIGKIGLSGNSTGAHLHFEVRRGERAVNPLDYLKR